MAFLIKAASNLIMDKLHGLANLSLVGIDIFTGYQLQRLTDWQPFGFLHTAMENSQNYISQLPLPSSRHGEASALTEMPHSVTNSRDGSRKHHISNLPEPTPKRVTLVERAGEPLKSNLAAPPSTRSVNPSIATNGMLPPPRNFSQSYRSNSSAARAISGPSNSSFSTSVGPTAIRKPSAQVIPRPKTSLAKGRVPSDADPRPATAMETRMGRIDEGPSKRMLPFSSLSSHMETRARPNAMRMLNRDRRDTRAMPPPQTRPSLNETAAIPAYATSQRNSSLSSIMGRLRLSSRTQHEPPGPENLVPPCGTATPVESPSKLPRPVTPAASVISPVPVPFDFPKSRWKSPVKFKQFLTKDSNIEAWDVDEKYANIEAMHEDIKSMNVMLHSTANENSNMKDAIALHKSTIETLEKDRAFLTETSLSLRADLETMKFNLATSQRDLNEARHKHGEQIKHLENQLSLESEQKVFAREMIHREAIEQLKQDHQDDIRSIKKDAESSLEHERSLRIQILNQASTSEELQKQQQEMRLNAKNEEIKVLKAEILRLNADLERESMLKHNLQEHLKSTTATGSTLEIARNALQKKIEYLESDSKSQSESYAAMERQRNDAIQRAELADAEVRKAEARSRRDRDTIQQLKGNIQVISRQRPHLSHDESTDLAVVSYPDTEEMKLVEVRGPEEKSSLGTVVTKKHPFAFDKAFSPFSTNSDVWNEINPLVQSSIDGFNVCIFAYGQTGSGKTYTMSAQDGVIPRAIHYIYDTTKHLEKLGWKYTVQGKFLEVYNENINDLLGDADQMDKKKHDIKHDMQKSETTITDVTVVDLDSEEMVESMLDRAMAKRSVAATKLNERSSRSHSVFILTLSGHNSITGESSKGTLNLVDLAGSERISRSKVEGERLKETQNINKSLSSLGDVIGALGKKEAHVPYRNSKLTHLLQLSLGGNSKTLMFVMVSPLKEHLNETLTSLKFAAKVHATHIGTAKRVGK